MCKFISFIITVSLLAWSTTGFSQETFVIHSREELQKMPINFRFLNPDFKEGYLVYSMNKRSQAFKINYDLYTSKLLFINTNNDTLLVKNTSDIKSVDMGSLKYVYDLASSRYFKLLVSDSLYSIVSYVEIKERPRKIDEGYGTNSGGASKTASGFTEAELTLQRVTTYYLLDRNGKLMTADKRNFLKIFDSNEALTKKFIKTNNIDFTNESDIRKLFSFCTQKTDSKN